MSVVRMFGASSHTTFKRHWTRRKIVKVIAHFHDFSRRAYKMLIKPKRIAEYRKKGAHQKQEIEKE